MYAIAFITYQISVASHESIGNHLYIIIPPQRSYGGYTGITPVSLSVDTRLGKMVSSAQMLPLYTYCHETSHAVSP